MRKITTHRDASELNQAIMVEVLDDPGLGGAHHAYQFFLKKGGNWEKAGRIDFQKGAMRESSDGGKTFVEQGPNGISHEALLAILIDRLQCFQKGGFSCRENACALTKLEEALHWLQARTNDRIARQVEGLNQP